MKAKLLRWGASEHSITIGKTYVMLDETMFADDDGNPRLIEFGEWGPVPESEDINSTLEQRGDRYGCFEGISELSQKLLATCLGHSSALDKNLSDVHREALTMICHKMARICNGDPNYDDSWRDIAGYATLVVTHLNGGDL